MAPAREDTEAIHAGCLGQEGGSMLR